MNHPPDDKARPFKTKWIGHTKVSGVRWNRCFSFPRQLPSGEPQEPAERREGKWVGVSASALVFSVGQEGQPLCSGPVVPSSQEMEYEG